MAQAYLVRNSEKSFVIVKTLADAEEYILSLSEEAVYRNYLREVYSDDFSHKEYIAEQKALMRAHNKRYAWNPSYTLYGFILHWDCDDYHIDEVEVLE